MAFYFFDSFFFWKNHSYNLHFVMLYSTHCIFFWVRAISIEQQTNETFKKKCGQNKMTQQNLGDFLSLDKIMWSIDISVNLMQALDNSFS